MDPVLKTLLVIVAGTLTAAAGACSGLLAAELLASLL
jgi:hypothetical protein